MTHTKMIIMPLVMIILVMIHTHIHHLGVPLTFVIKFYQMNEVSSIFTYNNYYTGHIIKSTHLNFQTFLHCYNLMLIVSIINKQYLRD